MSDTIRGLIMLMLVAGGATAIWLLGRNFLPRLVMLVIAPLPALAFLLLTQPDLRDMPADDHTMALLLAGALAYLPCWIGYASARLVTRLAS